MVSATVITAPPHSYAWGGVSDHAPEKSTRIGAVTVIRWPIAGSSQGVPEMNCLAVATESRVSICPALS